MALICQTNVFCQTKAIRLRNETITTLPATNVARAAQALVQPLSSGLYLIQFETHPEPGDLAALRASGVDLLKYVPDDTYIARFNQVSVDKIRALSFVRYVSPFKPEHKVHSRLTALAHGALAANQDVAVNVMLAPGATPAEVAQVRSLLSLVQHESPLRQGTVLRGFLPPNRLDALSQAGSVLWVEQAPKRKLVDEAATKLVGGDDGNVATPAITQQLGFTGAGVTVCVADTGLDTGNTNTMHPDVKGRVTGFIAYPPLTDGSDGYGHGTHCAGIVAGNAATGETDPDTGAWYGLGIASGANLLVERIFDDAASEVSPPPSDAQLTADAVRKGAQIGSNSWGNDTAGDYDTDAAQFDELVRDADPVKSGDQPYILEFSSGNAGPNSQTVGSPASAKNVITTGASENVTGTLAATYGLYADGPDTMADFSSRGPCADGRIKPDVVAPGSWIASMASTITDESAVAWSVIDNYYVYMGGTSMSGPYAAGAAAVFVQYYKSLHTNAVPSPALVKAALINSAVELDEANGGPGPLPNNDEGWGRITLPNLIITNIIGNPRYFEYVDQNVLLANSQVYLHHTLIEGSDVPLKITLAYTDVPGYPGAIPALVNDLDLEVVAPDGTVYLGNQFLAGESQPNATTPDNLNNVEAVHLSHPLPGDYLIRVRARNVVADARLDTAAIDQDFALVVSGNIARRGSGRILMDRTQYTAPGVIQLLVLDPDRAASNTVNVLLKSTTEPAGETYVLHASGTSGVFTGSVATVVGTAAANGKLEIHNGDTIEADYTDGATHKQVAQATAQLLPATLSNVTITSDLGGVTISWLTSEPANSIVRYSTNQSFNLGVTNADLVTTHTVRLYNLLPGKTYYFYVGGVDAAGNVSNNNNSGAYYSFVAVSSPTVLLVDAYDTAAETDNSAIVIPDSTYTNALTAAGFTYAFWKVNDRGAPQLSDLQPFPVVIWRTTDDLIYYGPDASGLGAGLGDLGGLGDTSTANQTNNTLTAQQQAMIQTYLNGGGAFFMASMGILSQVGDVPFRKNVLQIGGFKQNPEPPMPCTDCDEYFGVPAIQGANLDPISSGMMMQLDYSSYPSMDLFDDGSIVGPDFSDTFTPSTNATAILFETVSGKPCGLRYPRIGQDSPGRVVFLGFPLDTVPYSGAEPNNEVTLLKNILNFLVPGANGVGTVLLDQGLYSIPAQVTIEVGDSDLVGAGHLQVTFTTSSSTNVVTVTLTETIHPGLFRGKLTLSTTSGASQLAVRNGDTITAHYLDASNKRTVTATATIDTVAPVVSQVTATTDYSDATISWTTSKPADSQVQYGVSTALGHSVLVNESTTTHSVIVPGLQANQTYYYRVLSRDAAGNTVIDDNHGAFYTFSTLKAPTPPWSDGFETGAPGWTVVPDPVWGSEVNWTLGTPNNGLQSQAHSGVNAWGSDLNGQSVSFIASSYLFSPVIDLSGLTSATLTFWDAFDFSSQFEQGEILISTNGTADVSTLIPLANGDFSGLSSPDWEQETLDLTPYVGHTIQVVWFCQAISLFSSDAINGWLVDDVAITGIASAQAGTIVITKNISQGAYSLWGGGLNLAGSALSTTLSNIPPATYSISFGDIAFYHTPVSQTKDLGASGSIEFVGNYTFDDVNNNGISDDWEAYYFGSVSTNRTSLTDTDGDGMSDYSEFIAGTNPVNPASKLVFTSVKSATNHVTDLQWAAIPGRMYQLQSSTNLSTWTPASEWLQTVRSPLTYSVTNTTEKPQFYRIQVRP